jgi:hypothetical protein
MGRSLGLAVAVLVAAGCSGTPSPSASAASAPLSASPSATTASASAIASLATASAVATETPSVSATTTGGAWHRIGSIPTAYVGHVVAFSGGYVALAGVGRKVYVSVDGTTWHAVGLPFHATTDAQGRAMDAHASAIGSDGTTVVVVGGYGHGPCTGEPGDTGGGPDCPVAPMSWASTDGTTWRSGYPGPEPKDPAGYSQGSEFGAVWQAGTGFDAALGFWSGELASGRDVYHSTDGRSWSALAPGPALPGSSAKLLPEVHAGVADASGTRLLWELWYPRTAPGGVTTLSRSSDGESWSPAGSFDGDGVGVATALAPQATGGPWVLAGSTEDRSPIVWTSTDLETWQATLLPVLAGGADGDVGGLAYADGRYVAASASWDGETATASTWTSEDGLDWSPMPMDVVSAGVFGPRVLVAGPAGLLGVGFDPDRPDDASAVWAWR